MSSVTCYTNEEIRYCGKLYGKKEGDPQFDPFCDVYEDGVIDVHDITKMGANRCPGEPPFHGQPPLNWLIIAVVVIGLVIVLWLVLKK